MSQTEKTKNQAVGDVSATGGGPAQGGAGNVQYNVPQSAGGGNITNNFFFGSRPSGVGFERHLSVYLLFFISGMLVLVSLPPGVDKNLIIRLQTLGMALALIGFTNWLLGERRTGIEATLMVDGGMLSAVILLSSVVSLPQQLVSRYELLAALSVVVLSVVAFVWRR